MKGKNIIKIAGLAAMVSAIGFGGMNNESNAEPSSPPGMTRYVDDDSCPNVGSGTEVDPYCSIQDCIDFSVSGDECAGPAILAFNHAKEPLCEWREQPASTIGCPLMRSFAAQESLDQHNRYR